MRAANGDLSMLLSVLLRVSGPRRHTTTHRRRGNTHEGCVFGAGRSPTVQSCAAPNERKRFPNDVSPLTQSESPFIRALHALTFHDTVPPLVQVQVVTYVDFS